MRNRYLLLLILLLAVGVIAAPVLAQEDEAADAAEQTEVEGESAGAEAELGAEESHNEAEAADYGDSGESSAVPEGLTLLMFLAGLGAIGTVGLYAIARDRQEADTQATAEGKSA